MTVELRCDGCHRTMSSLGNLHRHEANNPVCVAWKQHSACRRSVVPANEQPCAGAGDTVVGVGHSLALRHLRAVDLAAMLVPSLSDADCVCRFCHRAFNCQSALTKHMKTSVVCDKWRREEILDNVVRMASGHAMAEAEAMRPPCGTCCESPRMRAEVLPGLWLIDKSQDVEDIQCVVNLSPHTPNPRPEIVEYHRVPDASRTSSTSDVASLEGFSDAAAFVALRRAAGRRVAVHCNEGFQRSVPFLVFYLCANEGKTLSDSVKHVMRCKERAMSCPSPHHVHVDPSQALLTHSVRAMDELFRSAGLTFNESL